MRFLYSLCIAFYGLAIRLAAPFNAKARQWVVGRKGLLKRIQQEISSDEKIIWVHCSSLGEFEQGRPLIEALKQAHGDHKLLLTFFSPSGYKVRKDYEEADYVYYLPLDTVGNARRFLDLTHPVIAVFIKYDFWFNYINQLNIRKIPLFVVSANFRKDQHFFKWYGAWFRAMLKTCRHIFVQSEHSRQLLESAGINQVSVNGDTRFDRVKTIADSAQKIPVVENFISDNTVFIAGSTWPEDDKLIIELIEKGEHDFKYIIVPHDIKSHQINLLLKRLGDKAVLYSNIGGSAHDARVLIVDQVGILSALYQYSHIAYVGGGFGTGIHNVLEPAAFGQPVLFGPNYKKFNEAVELIDRGGAFSIKDFGELNDKVNFLMKDQMIHKMACYMSMNYVTDNTGATKRVMEQLQYLLSS